jgi:hypothetical protein
VDDCVLVRQSLIETPINTNVMTFATKMIYEYMHIFGEQIINVQPAYIGPYDTSIVNLLGADLMVLKNELLDLVM